MDADSKEALSKEAASNAPPSPVLGEHSQTLLSAVLETAVEGIITIDSAGIVQSFNPAAERIFLRKADEVCGQNVNMLMPQPYAVQHDTYIHNYLDTRVAKIIGIGREVRGQRSDGSTFPMELSVSELQLPDGNLHFAGIVRDISERKDAERKERQRLAELAHAARLAEMGEMASGLAHELNQPLTAMVTYAKALQTLLDEERLEPTMLRETLSQIATQGLRAGDIVSRLRTMARRESSRLEPVNINNVVRDVLALVQHEIRFAGTQVTLALRDNLPMLESDRVQLEQVVLNFVRNAVEAMEGIPTDKRHLQISTYTHKGDLVLTVSDRGVGIAREAMEQLFDSFFTTKSGGVGLGLSISRSIIEAHGGRIVVENVAGGGARFTVYLPLDLHSASVESS